MRNETRKKKDKTIKGQIMKVIKTINKKNEERIKIQKRNEAKIKVTKKNVKKTEIKSLMKKIIKNI